MKQIDEMFARFIEDKPRLKRKWQMIYVNEPERERLHFYHYHHLIAVFDLNQNRYLYEWHEKPADLRGLEAIKEYMLSSQESMIRQRIKEGSEYHEYVPKKD